MARTLPATDSVKGIFIPQDYSVLNLKSPIEASSTVMPQRLYILVTSAPPSQTIARITITQNWEAIPSSAFSDLLTCSYNTFPSDFEGKEIFEYMIANNLVITKDESEFGLYKFLSH